MTYVSSIKGKHKVSSSFLTPLTYHHCILSYKKDFSHAPRSLSSTVWCDWKGTWRGKLAANFYGGFQKRCGYVTFSLSSGAHTLWNGTLQKRSCPSSYLLGQKNSSVSLPGGLSKSTRWRGIFGGFFLVFFAIFFLGGSVLVGDNDKSAISLKQKKFLE